MRARELTSVITELPQNRNSLLISCYGIYEFVLTRFDCIIYRALIEYDPGVITPREILNRIKSTGFKSEICVKNSFSSLTDHRTTKRWIIAFLLSLLFSIPVMIITWIPIHYLDKQIIPGLKIERVLLFIFSTLVQILGALQFYLPALKALRHKSASMDLLISLATTIAYLYSIAITIHSIVSGTTQLKTFFETSPMLITFISFGRVLEHIARGELSIITFRKISYLQQSTVQVVGHYQYSAGSELFSMR